MAIQVLAPVIGWFVKKFGVSGLLTALSFLYFGVVFAFYAFVILAFSKVYFLIQQLFYLIAQLQTAVSTFGGVTFSFGSVFYAIGFNDALSATYPLITSALVFVLVKFLYKYTMQVYKDVLAQATRAANLYV